MLPYQEAILRFLDPASVQSQAFIFTKVLRGWLVLRYSGLSGPFFSLGYNMEMALFALEVDLRRAQDLGGMTNLALLDLSEVFNTIQYGILLDQLQGPVVGVAVLQWFSSFFCRWSQAVL